MVLIVFIGEIKRHFHYFSSGTRTSNLLDNPCSLLSNTDSYTNWIAEYNNLRCVRKVDNSYTAYKYGNWIVNTLNYNFLPHEYYMVLNGCKHPDTSLLNPIGTVWYDSSARWECVKYKYNCFLGGINLNNGTCEKIDTEYKTFSNI